MIAYVYLIFSAIAIFAGLSGAAILIAFAILRVREARRQLLENRALRMWVHRQYINREVEGDA